MAVKAKAFYHISMRRYYEKDVRLTKCQTIAHQCSSIQTRYAIKTKRYFGYYFLTSRDSLVSNTLSAIQILCHCVTCVNESSCVAPGIHRHKQQPREITRQSTRLALPAREQHKLDYLIRGALFHVSNGCLPPCVERDYVIGINLQ